MSKRRSQVRLCNRQLAATAAAAPAPARPAPRRGAAGAGRLVATSWLRMPSQHLLPASLLAPAHRQCHAPTPPPPPPVAAHCWMHCRRRGAAACQSATCRRRRRACALWYCLALCGGFHRTPPRRGAAARCRLAHPARQLLRQPQAPRAPAPPAGSASGPAAANAFYAFLFVNPCCAHSAEAAALRDTRCNRRQRPRRLLGTFYKQAIGFTHP